MPMQIQVNTSRSCMCPCTCRNAGMPDRPAFGQFGTGLKKTNDAGTGSVPD
jgi:hypothetical protein